MAKPCDNCGHPGHLPGFEWVMLGQCAECPACFPKGATMFTPEERAELDAKAAAGREATLAKLRKFVHELPMIDKLHLDGIPTADVSAAIEAQLAADLADPEGD